LASVNEIGTLLVSINVASNFAQVLGPMMERLLGIQRATTALEHGMGRVRAAVIGVGVAFAGWELGKGLWKTVQAAEELNHQLVKLQTGARLTDAQTAAAERLAYKTTRDVRGSKVSDNVKMQRELFGVFGDFKVAQEMMPKVALASRAVGSYVDKDTDLAQIAVRALELRGHITKDHKVDPEEFAKELDSMVRSIVASEGMIDPAKLLMFIRQAGPAARNMTSEQMWGMAPAIMNALGAGPAGTAMFSLFSQFIGHVLAGKRVAVAMEKAGMLTHGKWRVERGGKVIMDPNAVPDQAAFMATPFTWLHDHLGKMREQKDKSGKPIDVVGIVQEIFQLASRATSARLINDIDTNWPVIKAEEGRYLRMPGAAIIKAEQDEKDVSVNINNLAVAWEAFLSAFGKAGNPLVITFLHTLTSALEKLTVFTNDHPEAAKALFAFAAGISAIAVIGGLALTAINLLSIAASLRKLSAAASAAALTVPLAPPAGAGAGAAAGAAAGAGAAGGAAASGAARGGAAVGARAAGVGLRGFLASNLLTWLPWLTYEVLALGSQYETPENRKALEDLRKSRGHGLMTPLVDGYDASGRPISPTGTIPPPPPPQETTIINKIILDGKQIAESVSKFLGNAFSGPSSAPTNGDPRTSILPPGLVVN